MITLITKTTSLIHVIHVAVFTDVYEGIQDRDVEIVTFSKSQPDVYVEKQEEKKRSRERECDEAEKVKGGSGKEGE